MAWIIGLPIGIAAFHCVMAGVGHLITYEWLHVDFIYWNTGELIPPSDYVWYNIPNFIVGLVTALGLFAVFSIIYYIAKGYGAKARG